MSRKFWFQSYLVVVVAGSLLIMPLVAARSQDTESTPASQRKTISPAQKLKLEGVDNAFRFSKKIISGACPNGEAGFRALQKLGVKTVVTVDGARPDLAMAKKYGMRYVHLPFGYNGVPRERELEIGRVVRDLHGPIFIHCHHGKHRGPAAAVLAMLIGEGWTVEQAVKTLEIVGTSPQYKGLYDAARDFKMPTQEELNRADNSFPETSPLPHLAEAMVEITARWEHLQDVRAAGWKVPQHHPDIDPPHEALLLQESFHELGRTPDSQKRSADYRQWLLQSETAAAALQSALREKDAVKAESSYQQILANCGSCHRQYRNAAPLQKPQP